MDVMSRTKKYVRPTQARPTDQDCNLHMQYNARTKHLHLDARQHCVHGAAGALRMQLLQGRTGMHAKLECSTILS